jgi:hypothetical protein
MHGAGVFSFARLAHRFGDPNGRLIVELGDGFVGDSDGVGNSALDNLDDDRLTRQQLQISRPSPLVPRPVNVGHEGFHQTCPRRRVSRREDCRHFRRPFFAIL